MKFLWALSPCQEFLHQPVDDLEIPGCLANDLMKSQSVFFENNIQGIKGGKTLGRSGKWTCR